MDRRSFCKVLGFAAGSTLLPGLMVQAAGQSSVGHAVPDGRYPIGIRSDLSGCDLTHAFYYSDSFFTHPATQYDHQLALATLGLVCAAANTVASDAEYWVNGSVGREAHIAAAYEALGFGDALFYNYDLDTGRAGDFVGYSLARKTLTLNGQRTTLVALILRGGGYGGEWASNFHIGDTSAHTGFVTPVAAVFASLKAYLARAGQGGAFKLWLGGYSRGSIIANLLAAKIARELPQLGRENIYAYGFAVPAALTAADRPDLQQDFDANHAPDGTLLENWPESNIFSIISSGDAVARVLPAAWGYHRNGVERVSKVMMPVLVVLSVVIAVYSVTRPGALAGVKYFLVPNPANFSWMTVVSAMGQMFYSLSIAMGILVTFGSYMKKNVSIEQSTENVEIFDTAIAIMAGLMIIPAVFAFSGGDPDTLQAGPALMFITIPKVFASMGMGTAVGVLFFVLVLFAALTSSIALTESAVSTFEDELGWDRTRSTILIGCIMITLGSLSALGYGPLAGVTVFGMQFLDFFDFLTNSVMMPIAAIATCLLVSRIVGVEKIEEEVTQEGQPFRRKPVFNFMLRYLCPIFAAIILASSVANALGWIAM